MTTTTGKTGGRTWPPVFPYSLNGYPRLCACTWKWDFRQGCFVKNNQKERCTWCKSQRAAVTDEAADPTTIQVSRAQRTAISDIQAELVLSCRRHVTTKETLSTIIEFWREHHRGDTSQGDISAVVGS